MADLSVSGTARRLLHPDRGRARVLVHLEGPERELVVTVARTLHERLVEDARRFTAGGAATDWSADQVGVSTADRWRGERKAPERVVVATASVSVTFVDFAALGGWLAAAAEQEGAVVQGVEWAVADERRRAVEREVRAEALLDARERARAYATAVGLETVELRAVFEPGLRRSEHDGGGLVHASARAAMDTSPAPEFELRPQELEIVAEVTADFTAR